MDALTEQLAGELGAKWVQLYSRLGLGARDRFRFITAHQDEPKDEKERSCTRDTIRRWREGVSELPEREAMTQLLSAFRKVIGFSERAGQIAESLGITLDIPSPPHTKTTSSPDSHAPENSDTITLGSDRNLPQCTLTSDQDILSKGSLMKPIPHTDTLPKSTLHPLKQGTTHTLPQSTPHSSQAGSNSPSEAGSDVESNTRTTSPRISHSSGHSQSSDVQSHHHHILDSPIDLRETIQKYAILDIAQRLPARQLTEIAEKLEVPQHTVRDIRCKHLRVEEVYYHLLKCWLESKEEEATFGRLREVLGECQQSAVSAVMLRRLDKGLLLKQAS